MQDTHNQSFAELIARIKSIDIGMLVIEDEQGALRSRPMATQRVVDGVLWFFTSKNSHKIEELREAPRVNVSYADPDRDIFVSVSGIAKTSRDPAKIRELWNERAQRWFPEGPAAPQLILLSVEITQAEYWDADTRTMIHLSK